jgi:hypothetical protein
VLPFAFAHEPVAKKKTRSRWSGLNQRDFAPSAIVQMWASGSLVLRSDRVVKKKRLRTSLPACPAILDVIGDLLADGRQIEEFLLNEFIFGLFSKLPIHSRLLPKIFIPVHVPFRRASQGHERIMSECLVERTL